MSALPPEAIVAAPAVIAALLYAIKQLSSFDLELRAHREHRRKEYLDARRLRVQAQPKPRELV